MFLDEIINRVNAYFDIKGYDDLSFEESKFILYGNDGTSFEFKVSEGFFNSPKRYLDVIEEIRSVGLEKGYDDIDFSRIFFSLQSFEGPKIYYNKRLEVPKKRFLILSPEDFKKYNALMVNCIKKIRMSLIDLDQDDILTQQELDELNKFENIFLED